MKQQLLGSGLMVGALWGACMLWRAPAQDAQVGPTPPGASTTVTVSQGDPDRTVAAPDKHHDGKPESKAGGTAKRSNGVDEILKMVQAGVSTEVIKTYIENSPIVYSLNATDVITLKEHAVPDELTTALMKRGATLRMQASQASNVSNASRLRWQQPRYSGLDPESYEYFQYLTISTPEPLPLPTRGCSLPVRPYPAFRRMATVSVGPRPFHPLPPSGFGHP